MIVRPNVLVRVCLVLAVSCSMTSLTMFFAKTWPVMAVVDSTVEPHSQSDIVSPSSHDTQEARVIQPGHRGRAVARVQRLLTELGLSAHEADGLYTEETAVAVRAFQTSQNIPSTGHVDRETWNALSRTIESSARIAPSTGDNAGYSEFNSSEASLPTISTSESTLGSNSQGLGVLTTVDLLGGEHQTDYPGVELFQMLRSTLPTAVGIFGFGACFYGLGRWSAARSHAKQKKKLAAAFHSSKPSPLALSHATARRSPDKRSAVTRKPINRRHIPRASAARPVVPKQPRVNQTTLQPTASKQTSPRSNDMGKAAIAHDPSEATTVAVQTSRHTVDLVETTRLSKDTDVNALMRDLESADPALRRRAIWELGQRGTTEAMNPLVDMMMTVDSQQRSLILAAIAEIGIRTLTPMNRALITSLQDDSSDVRKNAIRDIARVYELMGQVSTVLRHAANDEHEEVRETACWAMGQLNRMRIAPSFDGIEHRPKQMSRGTD
ncbi:MAG: HEAT repeat domain-containing protein [Cyanobacteria bacterium P01_E01_bin.6]